MFIASFPAGPWQTNCYVVATDRESECVIIDPGMDAEAGVADLVAEHRLKPVAVMLTHGHLDHMFSVAPLCRDNDAPCWVHPEDRDLLADPLRAMGAETRAAARPAGAAATRLRRAGRRPRADRRGDGLGGRDRLRRGRTPRGTPRARRCSADAGADRDEPLVFSGDVLFAGSIGRTDLPGGDLAGHAARACGPRCCRCPTRCVVLPGHGPQTTMAGERATNPYLRQLVEVGR